MEHADPDPVVCHWCGIGSGAIRNPAFTHCICEVRCDAGGACPMVEVWDYQAPPVPLFRVQRDSVAHTDTNERTAA